MALAASPPGPNRPMVAPPCGPNMVRDRFGNCGPLIQGEPDRPILLPQTPPNRAMARTWCVTAPVAVCISQRQGKLFDTNAVKLLRSKQGTES